MIEEEEFRRGLSDMREEEEFRRGLSDMNEEEEFNAASVTHHARGGGVRRGLSDMS